MASKSKECSEVTVANCLAIGEGRHESEAKVIITCGNNVRLIPASALEASWLAGYVTQMITSFPFLKAEGDLLSHSPLLSLHPSQLGSSFH